MDNDDSFAPGVKQLKSAETMNSIGSKTYVSKEVMVVNTKGQVPDPPDGGWGWMVVIGTILTGCLVPTLFICFGVFMNVFLEVFPGTSKSTVSFIPSIMNALMNCMGPITSALVARYSARTVTFCGAIVLSSGLCLSHFTNSIEALYVTYGIMGGIGAGLSFAPGLYLISQYFKKRRGLATGICMAGGSIGHITFPHIIKGLLDEYNYKGCLLILGGLTMNICVSAALFRTYEAPKPNLVSKTTLQQMKKNSLTFIPDEGTVSRNGSYSSMTSKSIESRKVSESHIKNKKKSKSKKRKNSDNNNQKTGRKNKKESDLLLGTDKNWPSLIKPGDVVIVSQNSPRGRSRTMSIDSSRILPGIPEEKEEEKPGNETSQCKENVEKLCKVIENVEDFSNGIGVEDISIKNISMSEDISIKNNKVIDASKCDNVVKAARDVVGAYTENVEDFSKDIGIQEIQKNSDVSNDDTATNNTIGNGCDIPKTERTVSIDSACEAMLGTRERVRRSDSLSEVVTLNHMFGSVASFTNIPKKHRKMNTLNNIYHSLGFQFFKLAIFYVLAASFSFLIVSLGSFTMFIPTYGVSINLSRDESAGLLSIIATASLFGRLILPAITDYISLKRKHIYFFSSMVSSASILGSIFVDTYTELAVCLVGFGFTSGGCVALSINVFLDYITVDKFASFFGLIGLVVGLSNLFAAPLMGLLVDSTGSYVATFGTLSASSALSGLVLYLDKFAIGSSSAKSEKTVVV